MVLLSIIILNQYQQTITDFPCMGGMNGYRTLYYHLSICCVEYHWMSVRMSIIAIIGHGLAVGKLFQHQIHERERDLTGKC